MTKPKSVSILLDAELYERVQAGAIEAGFISPDGGPRAKAIAVEGGYVGQGWYVDIEGQPLDRRGNGTTKQIAKTAATIYNNSEADSISEAIDKARAKSQ